MTSRGKPFRSGASGNPAGRPKGSRNRSAVALDAILEGAGEDIARKAVEMAKAGDTVALRLCLERLCPPRRDRPVTFDLPPIETAADVRAAIGAVVRAVAASQITPDEAKTVAEVIELQRRAIEMHDHDRRLAAIEEALTKGGAIPAGGQVHA